MTRSARALLIGLSLSLITASASAGLYKWTDERGVVHFTANLDEVPPRHRAAASAGSAGKGSFQQIGGGSSYSPAPAAPDPSASAAGDPRATNPTVATPTATAETHGGRTESQWQAEFAKYRATIASLEAEAERCENDEIRWTPGAGNRKWREEQGEAEVCSNVRSQLDMNRRQLETLEERAHRAGVPPGWIRD